MAGEISSMQAKKTPKGESADRSSVQVEREIRVFIVDDHPLVRIGLAGLFADQSGYRVCGEAENCEEALRKIPGASPDVALIDLALGTHNGFDLLRALRREHPAVRALVVTSYDEAKYAARAIREGACGYLMKCSSMADILVAVRRACRGDIVVGEAVKQQYLAEVARETETSGRSRNELSQREKQVFAGLAEGLRQKEMAKRFQISIKTVGCYCDRIKAKMGLARLRDVARVAHESHKPSEF